VAPADLNTSSDSASELHPVDPYEHLDLASGSSSEGEASPPARVRGGGPRAVPKRAKKGKADRSTWKRNNRVKRVLTYIGPCACAGKCWRVTNAKKRLQIREAFQKMKRSEQQHYLSGLVDVVRRKPRQKAMSVRRRRARRFESVFHLPGVNGSRVRVCKHHFKWVLRVQDTRLRNLGQAKIGNGDRRDGGRQRRARQAEDHNR
jgi:hypothetical protein